MVSGCSVKTTALRVTAHLLDTGVAAIYEETDTRFAREAMAGNLKLLETLVKNDSKNPQILLALSQGFGGYSFLFIEDEDAGRARYFYQKGRDYGIQLLGPKLSDLKSLGSQDTPALFWTAYCWGGWASLSLNDPDAIAGLPKVEAMVRRVEELHPGFFYSGTDLLLGAYYGSRPKMFGGDLGKSKSYFESAIQKTSGQFLMAQVLYAKYYAVAAQDRGLFSSLLESVIAAPQNPLPEQGLSNQVAKEKAKKLLGKINDLF